MGFTILRHTNNKKDKLLVLPDFGILRSKFPVTMQISVQ